MTTSDFAAHVVLDVASRLGKIIPTLDEYCVGEDAPPLTDLQKVALGSLLILLFDGLGDEIERMASVFEAILPFEGTRVESVGDEAALWLANRDDLGPAQ